MNARSSGHSSDSGGAKSRVTPRALLAAGVFGFGFSGLIDTLLLHLVL